MRPQQLGVTPRVAKWFRADLGCQRQRSTDMDEEIIDDGEGDATRASSPARSLGSPTFSLGGDLESPLTSPMPADDQRDAAASVRFSHHNGSELGSSFRKVLCVGGECVRVYRVAKWIPQPEHLTLAHGCCLPCTPFRALSLPPFLARSLSLSPALSSRWCAW